MLIKSMDIICKYNLRIKVIRLGKGDCMKEKIDLKKHKTEDKNIIEEMDFNKSAISGNTSSKKKHGIRRVITVLLMVLLTGFLLYVIALALMFYAFSKDDTSKWQNTTFTSEESDDSIDDSMLTEEQIEIKNTVSDFLDAVRAMDFKEAYKYTEDNECSLDFVADYLKKEDTSIVQYNAFFEKMMDYGYTISSVENNGDEASVNIVIKTYNFTTAVIDARLHISDAQIAYSFNNDADDKKKKEIAQKEVKQILNSMERKLKIPVEVKLVKGRDGWKITKESIDDGIKIAVSKNLFDSADAYMDFYKKLNDGEINEISVDSFIKYLESRGIHYDENSETSPFDE